MLAAQKMQGDLVANSVKENARRVADRLRGSGPVIGGPVTAGKVKVVPAYYSLTDGSVQTL